jgi:hypothetical protein
VISDESAAELLLELLLDVALVDESFGVAFTAAFRGANDEATAPADEVPDVAIELSCDQSIFLSPHLKLL